VAIEPVTKGITIDTLELKKQVLSPTLAPLWDFLFPPYCVGCDQDGAWLCDSCRANFHPGDFWPCLLCQTTRSPHAICTGCQTKSPLDGLFVAAKLEKTLQAAIHQFKYQFLEVLALPLGRFLIERLEKDRQAMDILSRQPLLMPVPLHPRRETWRGFNQSTLLAQDLVRLRPTLEMKESLTRTRNTTPQMKLDRETRLSNVIHAFEYNGPSLSGQTILLIDDVCTTGATLLACATELRKSNPKAIYAAVLAHG